MRPNLRRQIPARFYTYKRAALERVDRLKELGFTRVQMCPSDTGWIVVGTPPKGYK